MTGAGLLMPLGLAFAGVVTGLAWRLPAWGILDARAMRRINRVALPEVIDTGSGVLRLAGTTAFFVAALVLAGMVRPTLAVGLVTAALAAELITKSLKIIVRRQRPSSADPGVVVRLAHLPIDPSFPSGDAMRAAFLAGLALTTPQVPPWGAALCLVASVLVALGRVRAGAHYPLDVWAGFFLGLGAALAWASLLEH
jgi:membrane-associated phospholipid phosphatase